MALRLMCITAHPDDEAGAFGGALLLTGAAGVVTSVLCLTAGAAGSYRPDGVSDEELAATRSTEFAAACEALGVRQYTLLDYPDGSLWRESFQTLVAAMVEALRRCRPHVVLTFGPDGGVNLHRDHSTVSLAATAAFHASGRSGFFPEQLAGGLTPWAAQKLYYSCAPFLSTKDEEALQAARLVPVTLRLDTVGVKEQKFAAFSQHSTQLGVLERVKAEYGDSFDEELYHLAAARRHEGADESLLDGVVDDD